MFSSALLLGIYETFVISRLNLGVSGQFQMIWVDKNVSHNIWTTNDIKTCDFKKNCLIFVNLER